MRGVTHMTKASVAERKEAIEKLRDWIKPGDTVHTILRHVSQSGMSRDISVVLIDKDGGILYPDYLVAKATGSTLSKKQGIKIGGCGMDMGFALVSELSYALYGDGYLCTGRGKKGERGCPSNVHVNPGKRYYHKARKHTDGYALRQEWL